MLTRDEAADILASLDVHIEEKQTELSALQAQKIRVVRNNQLCPKREQVDGFCCFRPFDCLGRQP